MPKNEVVKRMFCITCKEPIAIRKIVAQCSKEIVVLLLCGHERHLRLGTPEDKKIWDSYRGL